MTRSFSITWDYLCPFARNLHLAVLNGLDEGRDWDVRFLAFSLNQSHADEDAVAHWDRPIDEAGSGVRALLWGIAVRDSFPEHFAAWHRGVYEARFDESKQIKEEATLREVATRVGLDPEAILAEVASGRPAKTLQAEHTEAADQHAAFGVPTVIVGDEAVFIRLMERGNVAHFEEALNLVGVTHLNEFKRTKIPR